jgi:hypothetical protein
MEKPKIAIHDVKNDKVIVREMNDEEYAQYLLDTADEAEAND